MLLIQWVPLALSQLDVQLQGCRIWRAFDCSPCLCWGPRAAPGPSASRWQPVACSAAVCLQAGIYTSPGGQGVMRDSSLKKKGEGMKSFLTHISVLRPVIMGLRLIYLILKSRIEEETHLGMKLLGRTTERSHFQMAGLIPESGRSPGEGNSNPLQYSCLENPMGGGAW